jgi:polysaccharide export outer membrane protein
MAGEQEGQEGAGAGKGACPFGRLGTLFRGVAAAGLAALVAVAATGCSMARSDITQVAAPPEVIRSSVRFQKEYLLYAGDQVEVLVWRVPEVSRTVTIRPDGYITLPLLQEVKAAGLTPRELAESLEKAYSKRLVKPEVTVLPTQVRQPMIYVLGDVKAPGAFPIRTAVTAAQALAMAGGGLRSASEGETTLIRLSDDGFLEAMPIGGEFSISQPGPFLALSATMLKADDIVFVPESGRSQVMRILSDVLVPFQIYLNYKLIEDLANNPTF